MAAFRSGQGFQRGFWVSLLLLLLTVGSRSRSGDCAGLSKQDVNSNRAGGGGGDGKNRLYFGKWESSVPTYALNWAQHQGTIDDLAEAHMEGISGENDYLASWATAAATEAEDQEEIDAINDDIIKYLKSNACAPGRDCTHYEQVGYVFNSMTL